MKNPCKSKPRVKILPAVPQSKLEKELNRLHRTGYDVEYHPLHEEPDTTRGQEQEYYIHAERLECACNPEYEELLKENELLTIRLDAAIHSNDVYRRNFEAMRKAFARLEASHE